MKTALTFLSFVLLTMNASFAQETVVSTGKFGGNGNNAPKLELNPDHTFSYTDLTRSDKPILFTGTWAMEKEKLVLSTPSSFNRKAMTVFKVRNDGKCLKARKGLAFYRLCNCE